MNIIKNIRHPAKKGSDEKLTELAKVVEIPIGRIMPNPDQPRKFFSPEALTGLAKSISQDGIVQPLTVRESKEGGYTLVSGERRLRAAKLAGCKSVPCVVVRISDKRSAVVALVENLQRAELNFFEEAEAISALCEVYRMPRDEIALRLGVTQSTVSNKLRLLRFPAEQRTLLIAGGLSERHARTLLRLGDDDQRKDAIGQILEQKMTVSQAEKYIDSLLTEEKRRRSYKKRAAVLGDVRLFENTVDKAVKVMKLAGVAATVDRTEHDGLIEFHITIPDEKAKPAAVIPEKALV